jgi:hypothetical protein
MDGAWESAHRIAGVLMTTGLRKRILVETSLKGLLIANPSTAQEKFNE